MNSRIRIPFNIFFLTPVYVAARLLRSLRSNKYRKGSFLTGLITSLTDLLQAYHQGRIGTSKTKSTGPHTPVLPRSLRSPNSSVSRSSARFALRIFFRPRREPENIYATRLVTLSAGELDTIS